MKNRLSLLVLVVLLIAALGVGAVQAQDTIVIKIASQSPLSGAQSVLGTGIRNAVELAIGQLSGPLTEMGFEVQFVPFDDQANPDVGVANAQQIVADEAILAVIGHLNSGVAIPSSEVYDSNDLVMVSPANTNPLVTDRALATVNRVCGRDDLQGPTGAEFAATLEGVESVYVLHDTTAYGQGVAEFFAARAEELGLIVLGFEGTEETANFDGIIQPILALDPDLIYMGGIYSQMAIFVSQAVAAGYSGQFMGPDGMDSSSFAELAGEAGLGTYYTSVAGPASLYPAAEQFIADYTEEFGIAPEPFGAQAYDSTAIALLGIAAAAEAAGGLPSRADVAAAVRATENYEGLTNTITFDDNGDPIVANYYVFQVGTSDPAEWSNNELIATVEIPSPLYREEFEAMQEPEETPEATEAP
jgi:branched-chain amino acid transport system substrate-binding protein